MSTTTVERLLIKLWLSGALPPRTSVARRRTSMMNKVDGNIAYVYRDAMLHVKVHLVRSMRTVYGRWTSRLRKTCSKGSDIRDSGQKCKCIVIATHFT